MPGIEDSLQSHDPLHDNLFWNPYRNIGFDIGLTAAGWGVGKYANKMKANVREVGADWARNTRVATGPSAGMDLPGRSRGGFAQHAARERRAAGAGHLKTAGADYKRVDKFGRTLKRFGRAFGVIAFAQLAFEGASALAGAGESFAISKDEMARQRYSQMYDQDTYYDTRAAYTQRQRALQVIHNSRLSMRPALGGESMYLHY